MLLKRVTSLNLERIVWIPYALITLGILRSLFPVLSCYSYDLNHQLQFLYMVFFPWDLRGLCPTTVGIMTSKPTIPTTAAQASILIGFGAWWLFQGRKK